MKLLGILSTLLLLLILNIAPAAISQTPTTTVAVDPLPKSGTYFIVNGDTKEALQPWGTTAGQNVFLQEFNQGGTQKWTVTRKIDPKTKKPLNRFTIRLAGENADLWLQPFPAQDHTCMVSSGAVDYTMAPLDGSLVVKSVALNGDALHAFPSPPSNTEARFGPSDGSSKFKWDFISAN